MGRNERRNVSRIKVENLPRSGQSDGKTGSLGKLTVETLGPGEGILFAVGPFRFILRSPFSPQDGVLSQ